MALAIGMNTYSFFDRPYKTRQQCTQQLDSQEDIVMVIIMEVVDSVSGILPSHISQR